MRTRCGDSWRLHGRPRRRVRKLAEQHGGEQQQSGEQRRADKQRSLPAGAEPSGRIAEQQVGGRQLAEPHGSDDRRCRRATCGTRPAPTATRKSPATSSARPKRSSPPREMSVRPKPNMTPAPDTNTGSETLRASRGVWANARPTPDDRDQGERERDRKLADGEPRWARADQRVLGDPGHAPAR